MFHKSHGACIARQRSAISVVDEQPEGVDIDPSFTLFTTSQCLNEPELHTSTSRLQRFSHKYALAVLMANACGSSALWDETGQLIVRADKRTAVTDRDTHDGGLARRYHSITLNAFGEE
ncbi:Putative amido hydrolase [Salmonella bongori]|nr:Putative amido hydrolase [Salmonella bongori]